MGENMPSMKFKKEVLDLGAEACLPGNLSDDWINYLVKELEFLNNACDIDDEVSTDISCSLAAVVTILHAQNGGGSMYSAKLDDVFNKIIDFRIELGLESVSRNTEIKYEPATLDTIFSDRTVKYWIK